MVDEAYTGFVFNHDDLAGLADFKVIVAVILDEVLRAALLIEKISVILQPIQPVNACLDFRHMAYKGIDVLIKHLIAVDVEINSKQRIRQLVVRIIRVHLGCLDRTGNPLVDRLDFNALRLFAYRHPEQFAG